MVGERLSLGAGPGRCCRSGHAFAWRSDLVHPSHHSPALSYFDTRQDPAPEVLLRSVVSIRVRVCAVQPPAGLSERARLHAAISGRQEGG